MTLRRAAEQALAAIKSANQVNYSWACVEAVAVLEAALAEPEQEPVAWMEMVVANLVREGINKHKARELAHHFAPPPQRKPLSDEEIEQAYRHIWSNLPKNFYETSMEWIEQGIRYAEQAHGIKGEA